MQLDLFIDNEKQRCEPDLNDPGVREKIIEALSVRRRYKNEVFYTLSEVSDLLGLSYFQVFTLCKWYKIVPVKIHQLVRIPVQELIDYLQEYERIYELEGNYYTWMNSRTRHPLSPVFAERLSPQDGQVYAS